MISTRARIRNPIRTWREMRPNARREALAGYFFISPWLLGFIIFFAVPILASFVLSFTRWNIVSPPKWVGLRNYQAIFTTDRDFIHSLKVTVRYSLIYIPLTTVVGIAVAMALNSKVKGVGIFRTLFYLPYIAPTVASSLVFMWILHSNFGLVNVILKRFGIDGPNWFNDPRYALWGIIMIALWGVGGSAVIYLAGLQNIPQHLYDAAKVDGANSWEQFRHVTLPMLTSVIFFQLVVELIGVFQTFTSAFVISADRYGAGPIKELFFYMIHVYIKAWQSLRMGYAAALSWILTLIILLITVVVFRSSPYWVYYEAEKK